jgi:hypothetical protein
VIGLRAGADPGPGQRAAGRAGAAGVRARVSRPTLAQRLAHTPVVDRVRRVPARTAMMNPVRTALDAEGVAVASSSTHGLTGAVCTARDAAPGPASPR